MGSAVSRAQGLLLYLLQVSQCYADPASSSLPSTLWMAPILNPGGYSSEALSYALALYEEYVEHAGARFGLRQFAEQSQQDFIRGLPQATSDVLKKLFQTGREDEWDVVICHATPDVWHSDGAFGWGYAEPCPARGAKWSVGRTMYETDQLPPSWVPRINAMDETWVPSHFGQEQFISSGVLKQKVLVVPEAVDTSFFDPDKYKPLKLGDEDATWFRFLSVFKWEKRKGWDLLLRAYFEEFSADDPVQLLVKTQAFHTDQDFQSKVEEFLASQKVQIKRPMARYKLLSQDLPLRRLPNLYRAADAFVLPTRGEGWGRPIVEAMAMGLPVIATNWSGSTEFLRESNSLLLPIEGLEEVEKGHGPEGHRWAVPSLPRLRELMRWLLDHQDEGKAIGLRAREEMVAKYSPRAIVQQHLLPRLRRIKEELKELGRAKREL